MQPRHAGVHRRAQQHNAADTLFAMRAQIAQDHQAAQTVADQMNYGFAQAGDARSEPARVFVQALRHRTVIHHIGSVAAARKQEAQALHRPAAHPQPMHQDHCFAHQALHM